MMTGTDQDTWNVTAELDVKPTRRAMTAIAENLAAYHPAVSATDAGRIEVTLTVPAEPFPVAVARAVHEFRNSPVAAFTIITTSEFDRRTDDAGELVDAKAAAEMLGVTRQRVQQLHAAGQITARKVGNSLVIPKRAVEAYAASRKEN